MFVSFSSPLTFVSPLTEHLLWARALFPVCPQREPPVVALPTPGPSAPCTGSLVMWEESCPLVCRNSWALSPQLWPTPAAGWTILAVSRGAGGSRKRPGSGPGPAGGFGLGAWRWSPRGALFSRASAFPAYIKEEAMMRGCALFRGVVHKEQIPDCSLCSSDASIL